MKMLKRPLIIMTRRLSSSASYYPGDGNYRIPIIKEKVKYPICNFYHQIDTEKSKGNFAVLKNGNAFLDLDQNGGTLPPLGYSNDQCIMKENNLHDDLYSDGNPHGSDSKEYYQWMKNTIFTLRPDGMNEFPTLTSHHDPLSVAISASVTRYQENCKEHWDPAYLGFHDDQLISGKFFTVISLQSSGRFEMNVPYNTKTIYLPTSQTVSKNASRMDKLMSQQEAQCLQRCFQTIKACFLTMKHPAVLIIDPVYLGEDILSNQFYQSLQAICFEFDVAFVVDETKTCLGVTGGLWCHDSWNLQQPPDIVVFGKKMLNTGFFSRSTLFPHVVKGQLPASYDISRLKKLNFVLDFMCDHNLFTQIQQIALKLKDNMIRVQECFPSLISNVQCNGLLCTINFFNEYTKQQADHMLLDKGLHFGRANDKSLTMTPTLMLGEHHVQYISDCLHEVMTELNQKMSRKII